MPGRCKVPVLLFHDDAEPIKGLSSALEKDWGEVFVTSCLQTALKQLEGESPWTVLADLAGRPTGSLNLLRRLTAAGRHAVAVALAESDDYRGALKAVKLGVHQVLRKPVYRDDVLAAIEAAAADCLEQGTSTLSRRRLTFAGSGKRLLGGGPAMSQVLRRIDLVRHVDSNVIIRGDTGTGKELIARVIHNTSPRAEGPFVKLNCGAIPKDLLESELFGHEKGAFTGAMRQRIGRFEMAHRGTILLDEIGDMPLELQVKLLSVIQDRAVQRVGGHERIPVDVRIIAATHQDLEKAIEKNRFREDLYYRLKVVTIRVPNLGERREDIPLLAHHFMKVYARVTGRTVKRISSPAMQLLESYHYPGNVRELENVIQSATVFCQGETIEPKNLPNPVRSAAHQPANEIRVPAGTPLEEVERVCIIETLKYTDGNKRQAAVLLGISEKSIYNKLERHNIPLDAWKAPEEPGDLGSAPSEQYEHA